MLARKYFSKIMSLWKCNDFLWCVFLYVDEPSKCETHFYPMGDWLFCLYDRARLYKWKQK